MWATKTEICGHHIIRRNIVRYCGISGITGPATQDLLVERNLIEWVGWQDAERAHESAGVKFHGARNLLFRHNVLRHFRHASGIWLDVGNVDCRLTGNVFADIVATTKCAIQIEGSHEPNQIDNNLIWRIGKDTTDNVGGWGIYIQGTDKLTVAHNLIAGCDSSGIYARAIEDRIIAGRGGTSRDNRIYNNIFHRCNTAAIDFANEHNAADGNVYGGMRGGFLRILSPAPPQWLDLAAWSEFHGWDANGQMAEMEMTLDPDKLDLMLSVKGALSRMSAYPGVTTDFFGRKSPSTRPAGPFPDIGSGDLRKNVDPRRESR
jgi:hypothetical protein